MPIEVLAGGAVKFLRNALLVLAVAQASPAASAGLPEASLTLSGTPEIVYDPAKDACTGIDVPDQNPRAYRDAGGQVVFSGLHFINRMLRGPDLAHLKMDCEVVLGSIENPDPAAFEGRNYLAAPWTEDGRKVIAIVHQEYHADQFGKCPAGTDLACWFNSLLAFRSEDGGHHFTKSSPSIVAVAPFRQEFGQGRHRGFFQPSNIFSDGPYRYFFGATTGWDGQDAGVCLFRSGNVADSASWRAFDGKRYSVTFANPYASGTPPRPAPCKAIAPFGFPVGAVVRQRGTGLWIAIFQAVRNGEDRPLDGFYYATARNLTNWSLPRLFLAKATNYNDLCTAGGPVLAYPALLDENAKTRNFEDIGDNGYLYYTELGVKGCAFDGMRKLMRVKLDIRAVKGR